MAKDNLELILHDKHGVRQRLLEISATIASDSIAMSQLRDNQRGLIEVIRSMQEYITILAEEMKEAG